jgi:hypothetical protein
MHLDNAIRSGHGSVFNALKHGLRTDAILLPGEDPEAFQHLRHDLFRIYQPRTRDEALCVEDMASHRWRMARCQRRQAVYEEKLDLLPGGSRSGERSGAHEHCDSDPHRWMHKSMDCELLEGRLDRRMTRTRDKLLDLQHLRRHNLIPGAIETTADWRELERQGAPVADGSTGESAAGVTAPAVSTSEPSQAGGASRPGGTAAADGVGPASLRLPSVSSATGMRKNDKRTAEAPRSNGDGNANGGSRPKAAMGHG